MSCEIIKAFVTKADGKIVRIKVIESSIEVELSRLGFIFDPEFAEYSIQTIDNSDKAELFDKLRKLNIGFSAGKEWCPSEVFEYMRKISLIKGKYTKISWSSPNNFHVSIQ